MFDANFDEGRLMSRHLIIKNASIVLGTQVMHGTMYVQDGKIADLSESSTAVPEAIDFAGDYLLPGLVEIHTDNYERHMMPRPKTFWPPLPALLGHDAECAAAGITTVFDALGVGDADPDAMRGQDMRPLLDALAHAQKDAVLRISHYLHIRAELPAPNTLELFAPFEKHPSVKLISLMDHTPGQRQWEDVQQARTYYTGKKGWSDEKFAIALRESADLQSQYAQPHRQYFVEYARNHSIPLASHDDTRIEHVKEAVENGVAICEFPTRIEAAAAARENKMAIVMGAPNMVRGGSHSGNVAARTLAQAGLLDVMSSDYVPTSLLMAAFRLVDQVGWTLPAAVATVSRNPARAVGLHDRGEIAIGQNADLIQVKLTGVQPVVRSVWREGQRVC